MKYCPLKSHTSFSLLKSTNLPEPISVRLTEIGSVSSSITDYYSLSGVPSFIKSLSDGCLTCGFLPEKHEDNKGKCLISGSNCNEYIKSNRKTLIGQKVNLDNSDIHIISKSKIGWKNLIKLSSLSNHLDHFDELPKLSFEELDKFKQDLIVYSGEPRSDLANFILTDKSAYHAKTYDEAKSFIKDRSFLKKDLFDKVNSYKLLFKENFFLGIQLNDKKAAPISEVLANIFRWIGKELNIKTIALPNPHYTHKEVAADHRILLCNELDTSLEYANDKITVDTEYLSQFFKSNNYHIPSYDEMIEFGYTEEELKNTLLVDEMCEKYEIFGKPLLPKFECPGNKTPDEYLRELCIEGWKTKLGNVINDPIKKEEYGNRVKEELKVLSEANLSSYFLVVQDFSKYARTVLGCPNDPGRGSASGCLVSYLINITDCDPIKYDLSFSRFYNSGRNDPKAGKFAMPDIDMDFPPYAREPIMKYIREKFTPKKVAQMATFTEYKGKEALTAVFRGHGWGSFRERKEITALIAQKDRITDDLQDMIEETGESSIIKWSIENVKELQSYCSYDNGVLVGPLSKYFEQAIRMEGIKKSQSVHASGIIISPIDIDEICPLILDKNTKELITSFDMYAAEPTGLLKFDILGSNISQKIVDACKFAKYGKVI